MVLKRLHTLINRYFSHYSNVCYNEKGFLIFFRVAVGVVALLDIASILPDIGLLFSADRTVVPQELMYFQSGYYIYLNAVFSKLQTLGIENYFYSLAPVVYICTLIFLITGLFTRAAAILCLLLQLTIFRSFDSLNYGYDHFITMSLFYCVVFPVGKYWSIDRCFFKKNIQYIQFNYRFVLQIHLCIVYFSSGIFKALGSDWWNGNAVWRSLASLNNNYHSIPSLLLLFAGIGTLLLETLYPFLVFKKKSRQITILLSILMHASIGVAMQLYSFAAIMIVWNIAAFGKPTEYTQVIHEKAVAV